MRQARTTEEEYAEQARGLPDAIKHDLLSLGRGAKARLARDGDKLCVKVRGKFELTSKGYILRSKLLQERVRWSA
jgi:hypothetical protein